MLLFLPLFPLVVSIDNKVSNPRKLASIALDIYCPKTPVDGELLFFT
jgi:hypothetical protein